MAGLRVGDLRVEGGSGEAELSQLDDEGAHLHHAQVVLTAVDDADGLQLLGPRGPRVVYVPEIGPQHLARVGHRLGIVGQPLAGEPEVVHGVGQRTEPQ